MCLSREISAGRQNNARALMLDVFTIASVFDVYHVATCGMRGTPYSRMHVRVTYFEKSNAILHGYILAIYSIWKGLFFVVELLINVRLTVYGTRRGRITDSGYYMLYIYVKCKSWRVVIIGRHNAKQFTIAKYCIRRKSSHL